MELRVLQYFLAVAREQSISGAAEYLHLSQPTLSRQLKDLEEELGKQLFIRGNRKITLTEEGMILRKRAQEILELVNKTETEIALTDLSGDIYIGTGETDTVRHIIRAAQALQKDYSSVHFHIVSGDAATVLEHLDKGLLDFGVVFGSVDTSKYEHLTMPDKDIWGVMMRCDSPLAAKSCVPVEDLWDKPLIVSRQAYRTGDITNLLHKEAEKLNIVATYNLLFNGSLMVAEGMGYAICLDKIINVSGDSNLCFRPFSSPAEMHMNIIWKKYQFLTKASSKYLNILRAELLSQQ